MTTPLLIPILVFFAELAIMASAVVLWRTFPGFGSQLVSPLRGFSIRFAKKRRLAAATMGVFALAGALLTSLQIGIPAPAISDEFSYLLGAQTIAEGRLYGSPHPMPEYFETFHVLQRPVHASKYPPGQAVALAAGTLLFGQPIVGVWLLAGLAAAATTWMLQAWLPARWALLGGFLAAVHLGFFSSWSQSYWGGLLAALGGALFLGGFRRTVATPNVTSGAIMGAGAAILLGVRPFEGGLLVLFTGLASLAAFPCLVLRRRLLAKPILVAAAPILLVACTIACYNWQVMGDPLEMPYAAYENQTDFAPVFLFLPLPPGQADIVPEFAAHRAWTREEYVRKRSAAGFTASKIRELSYSWAALGGPALLIAFGSGLFSPGGRWHAAAALILVAITVALTAETFTDSRKFAPATSLVFLLAAQGLRRHCQSETKFRHALFRAVLIAVAGRIAIGFNDPFLVPRNEAIRLRPAIEESLLESSGHDLVVVRYAPDHIFYQEWVYNEPEIDQAEVVWARDLGPSETCRLIQYYERRNVWLLQPDDAPLRIEPYPSNCSD